MQAQMQAQPPLEQLVSTLIFLLSRYTGSPDPKLTAAIRDHLIRVTAHPDTAEFPALRNTCRHLASHWESHDNDNTTRIAAPRSSGVRIH